MNTENFYNGQAIKNYQEFCSLAGEKPVGGKQKQLQIERWGLYMEFNKEQGKNSYIIKQVRDVKLSKYDKRSIGNNSKYNLAGEALLLDKGLEFIRKDETLSVIPMIFLRLDMGFCNEDYNLGKINKFCSDAFIKKVHQTHLSGKFNRKSKQTILTTLKLLKNNGYIEWGRVCYCYRDSENELIPITEKQEETLEIIYKHVLGKYNSKNMMTIYSRNMQDKFYARAHKIFYRLTRLEDLELCCVLNLSESTIQNKSLYGLSKEAKWSMKKKMNSLLVKYLTKSTLKFYQEKVFKKTYSDLTEEEIEDPEFKFLDDYLYKQMAMIGRFVAIYDLKIYKDDCITFVR